MNDTLNTPPLPTTSQLLKATGAALVISAVIVVIAVLPAEYAIDPSGLGRRLGLLAMGELKHRPPATPSPETGPATTGTASTTGTSERPAVASGGVRSDEIIVVLKPNESTEVKAVMKAGLELTYSWTADRGVLNYDFHGEPKGAAKDVFESYQKGTDGRAEGKFITPFEGTHGWYWKNRTSETITITVKTSGAYEKVSRLF